MKQILIFGFSFLALAAWGQCDLALTGSITNVDMQELSDVEIILTTSNGTSHDLTATGLNTTFSESTDDFTFSIALDKKNDDLNGVSTLDQVLIQRHILGIESFTEVWQLIAADANDTGTTTAADMVEFRKLVLGIYTTLPNAPSWEFFDDQYGGHDYIITVENCAVVGGLGGSDLNFIGVKIGDVNNTHIP